MIDTNLEQFWVDARRAVPTLPETLPEVWAFGATAAHADELLSLVLAGTKTGTAFALAEVEAEDEVVPEPGDLSVILDGTGCPRAVVVTTEVEIVPFTEVTVEHAYSEGEGDRTLAQWRAIHEAFWREYGLGPDGFSEDMLIACERFRLMYAQ